MSAGTRVLGHRYFEAIAPFDCFELNCVALITYLIELCCPYLIELSRSNQSMYIALTRLVLK